MDRRRAVWLLALTVVLLVLPALSGCIGGDAGDGAAGPAGTADGNGTGVGGDGGEDAAGGFAVLTFDEEAFADERWFNGTYAPQETCFGGGCLTGDAQRAHDVAELLPEGRVVQLTVELRYEPGAVTFGQHVQVWVSSEDALFYDWTTRTWEIGHVVMDITVVRQGGSFDIVTFGFAPQGDAATEIDYTLRVAAGAQPDRVPAGVPVPVELAPGRTLTVHAYDEGEPSFVLFGPDDGRIGHFADDTAATYIVPEDGPAGAYVLVGGETDLHLVLEAAGDADAADAGAVAPAPLRPLWLEGEAEVVDVYDGTGEVTWEFDAADRLLAAGVFVHDRDLAGAGVGPWATTGFDLEVTSPDGETAGGGFTCFGCLGASPFLGSFSTGWGFGVGDPHVVDGTYAAALSSDASAGFEYGHWMLRYVR